MIYNYSLAICTVLMPPRMYYLCFIVLLNVRVLYHSLRPFFPCISSNTVLHVYVMTNVLNRMSDGWKRKKEGIIVPKHRLHADSINEIFKTTEMYFALSLTLYAFRNEKLPRPHPFRLSLILAHSPHSRRGIVFHS